MVWKGWKLSWLPTFNYAKKPTCKRKKRWCILWKEKKQNCIVSRSQINSVRQRTAKREEDLRQWTLWFISANYFHTWPYCKIFLMSKTFFIKNIYHNWTEYCTDIDFKDITVPVSSMSFTNTSVMNFFSRFVKHIQYGVFSVKRNVWYFLSFSRREGGTEPLDWKNLVYGALRPWSCIIMIQQNS